MCAHPGASQAGHYSKLVICYKLCEIFLETDTNVYLYLLVIIRWEKWQSIKKIIKKQEKKINKL